MREFYRRLADRLASHASFAVATIVKVAGSSPRDAGAKVIVFQDGALEGTLGGGKLESEVVRDALECLRTRSSALKSYWLNDDGLGMKCGGTVEVFFEAVTPPTRLVVFGGGHVGRAIARLAPTVGFAVEVVDDRADQLDPSLYPAGVTLQQTDAAFREGFADLGADDYVVVVTRDAATDASLAGRYAAVCAYVGVMGSKAKRGFMQRAAAATGVPAGDFERVSCPMGADIGADTPDEIAVSVVAEMIERRSTRRAAPPGPSRAERPPRTTPPKRRAAANRKRSRR
ncbi:MAG: XdhC family protein [Hyphomicrobiales bacterium]